MELVTFISTMDPPRPPASEGLVAPPAGARSLRAPGREELLPGVDERLVEPEGREEIIEGERIYAAPADAPHATQHFDLGYIGAVAELDGKTDG